MNHPLRRPRRLLAGMLVGALALTASPLLGMQPAGAADALPPLADPLADGAFCDGAPSANSFNDLGAESPSTRGAILCLVATELTTGTTATTYSPGAPVTRRQMAVFIKRLADLLEELETGTVDLPNLPAYDGTSDFSDVAASDPAVDEIDQLAQADIVGGFSDGTFRPNAPVSRRQMAAFINRLQDFLGGAPFTTTGDFFDDDNGDTGEANLNALAAVGIFQGDGAGNVTPGGTITRRQMANILLRAAQVYYANGIVFSPFASSNQDFAVTPTASAVLEHDETRQFTVTGLDPAAKYDIALFSCANVTGSGDNPVTFVPQGDATKAAPGTTTGAALTVVNGVNTANGDNITPVSGGLTFTVTSTDTVCVVPVVFQDTVNDDTLQINGSKQPTDLFGIGGDTQFVPAEAASGGVASGEVTLVGTGFAVLDDTATVYFNPADAYRIQGTPFYDTVTGPVFFQNLSVGDSLSTCQTNLALPDPYTQGAANEYCLVDAAPVGPTAVNAEAGTPSDSSIKLTWTASASPGVTAHKVYANDETCALTTVGELASIGTVAAPTATYTATGLTAGTTYCFVVTAVQGSDEGPLAVGSAAGGNDNTVERATTGTIEAPTIASAVLTTDAVTTEAVDSDDVITLRFSEAMNPATVLNSVIAVTDADGDTTSIKCVAAPAAVDNGITEAECQLGNGAGPDTVNNDTLRITLGEDGDDANAGGAGTLLYPLTIGSITGLQDADDLQGVNVAGSADKEIS